MSVQTRAPAVAAPDAPVLRIARDGAGKRCSIIQRTGLGSLTSMPRARLLKNVYHELNVLSGVPARLEYACGHHALVSLQGVKGETGVQRRQRIEREKAAALARPCDFCGPVAVEAVANGMREVIRATEEFVGAAEQTVEGPVTVVEATSENGDVSVEAEDSRVERPAAPEAAETPRPAKKRQRPKRQRQRPVRFTVNFVGMREVEALDIYAAVQQAEALGLDEIIAVTRVG
jgi:hypothetical protein